MLADLQAVVARLHVDGRFYRLVLEWPDELCRQYALSSDEVDALQSADEAALVRLGLSAAEAAGAVAALRPARALRGLAPTYSRRGQFWDAYAGSPDLPR
jgi:hypothetical protein